MSQKIAGLGNLRVTPREQLERVGVGHRQDVGFLDPGEPVDRRTVEGHAVLEGVLELRRGDGEALEIAEDVGEPQSDESDAALFDAAQDVVALLVQHLGHSPSLSRFGRECDRAGAEAPALSVRSRLATRVVIGLLHRAADRLDHQTGDDVRVDVGVRATILEVALPVDGDLPRDADRGATVGHAVAELVVALGLVGAGQAVLDAACRSSRCAARPSCRAPCSRPRCTCSRRRHASPWWRSSCGRRRRSSRPSRAWRRGWRRCRSPRRSGSSNQRATHSWSATSSRPSGPTWNSHCPGMTSALMPEIDRPAARQASR